MNIGRAESPTDELILSEWIRRGLIHPPLLSWAWPGASPMVIEWPMTITKLRAHYYFDHCQWHYHWKFPKLAEEHAAMHEDPLFSHVRIGSGERIHMHGTEISGQPDTGEEWEW